MLRATFIPDFKSSNTLLIWGDNSDMARLSDGLLELRWDERSVLEVEGGQGLSSLRVRAGRGRWVSRVSGSEDAFEWVCSPDVLKDCLGLIEPLLTSATGHQYVDTQGDITNQVVIAVNEYPDNFRL